MGGVVRLSFLITHSLMCLPDQKKEGGAPFLADTHGETVVYFNH